MKILKSEKKFFSYKWLVITVAPESPCLPEKQVSNEQIFLSFWYVVEHELYSTSAVM